jgi:hypothetical protein
MLKGTRTAVLQRIQPVSIHGQISCDVHFVDPDDPDGQPRVARIGPESVDSHLSPGDRIILEYVLGTVISVKPAGSL